MSPGPGTSPHQKLRVLAGIAALVLLAAGAFVAIYLIWGTDAAKERRVERRARLEEPRRSETEAPARAEEAAEQERLIQGEQARRTEEQRRKAEQELVDERRRIAEQVGREQETTQRLAEERARADAERQAAMERQRETERRLAAELEAKRKAEEAEEAARREEAATKAEEEAEEEARRIARETAEAERQARQEETKALDDTPEVESDSTIDDVEGKRGWSITGDLRPIFIYEDESGRDGSEVSDDSLGVRARLAVVWGLTKKLRLGARLAGRCFTEDCHLDWVMDSATPASNGLTGGQVTLDQFFLHWSRRARSDVAVGRLQTKFILRGGVFPKSLDRNDSNNVNVTWTDGLHATYRARNGWDAHLVLQQNADDGTGSIRRGPLDFDDGGARITYFTGLENRRAWGPVVQRAFDVSYLPSSLLKDGDPDGRREDYWGVVGRLAARWPQRSEGARLRVGTEVGFAPETPTGAASQLNDSGDVDGLAWNVVASVMDFTPSHSIGLNYGRTDAGWLLSPQYRENDELLEIRYQWRPSHLPLLEARVRWREELEPRTGAIRKRDEFDFYARLTWQFKIKDF
jgi:hypothetical protein